MKILFMIGIVAIMILLTGCSNTNPLNQNFPIDSQRHEPTCPIICQSHNYTYYNDYSGMYRNQVCYCVDDTYAIWTFTMG